MWVCNILLKHFKCWTFVWSTFSFKGTVAHIIVNLYVLFFWIFTSISVNGNLILRFITYENNDNNDLWFGEETPMDRWGKEYHPGKQLGEMGKWHGGPGRQDRGAASSPWAFTPISVGASHELEQAPRQLGGPWQGTQPPHSRGSTLLIVVSSPAHLLQSAGCSAGFLSAQCYWGNELMSNHSSMFLLLFFKY